jgi:hypothetical protein
MTDKKATSIEFAPGCFDNFEGTQEELDALKADIQRMFETGELEANAVELDLDDLYDEDPESAEAIFRSLDSDFPRNLH